MTAEIGLTEATRGSFLSRKSGRGFKLQSKDYLEFYSILADFSKTHALRLNIPETVVFGYSMSRPTLIRTNNDQVVVTRESLSSPEYLLHSVVSMLLHCSMVTKPSVPIAIYKESDGESSDLCIPLMNLQAGQLVWNTRLAQMEPAFIQRYIYNGSPCAFVFRVTHQPTLNYFTYQIFQNVIPVAQSSSQFSHTLRYAFEDKRETLRRRKAAVIQLETDDQDLTPSDRFCVTTSVHESFEVCSWKGIESVKQQVMAIKWVLEKGYLSDYNLELLELVVDFCQDKDKKWYFICLHSYKTELVVKKKISSDSLGKLIQRLMQPVILDIIRPKSASPKKRSKRHILRKKPLSSSFSRWNFTSTVGGDDFRQTMVQDILRDIEKHPVKAKKSKDATRIVR